MIEPTGDGGCRLDLHLALDGVMQNRDDRIDEGHSEMNCFTGPHRSREVHLHGLLQRKRFLCSREPTWERRGPRDREIAALNDQIDHLLDHWVLRPLPKPPVSELQAP